MGREKKLGKLPSSTATSAAAVAIFDRHGVHAIVRDVCQRLAVISEHSMDGALRSDREPQERGLPRHSQQEVALLHRDVPISSPTPNLFSSQWLSYLEPPPAIVDPDRHWRGTYFGLLALRQSRLGPADAHARVREGGV